MEPFIPCSPRRVRPELRGKARKIAWRVNPGNRSELPEEATIEGTARLALDRERRWYDQEVDLTVQFLDAPPAELRREILAHMNSWGETAAVRFRETRGYATVRIARAPGDGHWSYVGTDVLVVTDPDEPTMNLDGFTVSTPERELRRVVRHETGHTLGFQHEHLRREIVDRIDPDRAIRYFERSSGWEPDEVRLQVLTPLEEASIFATPDADETSIMTYSLPAEIMRDGQAVVGGTDITALDREHIARIYPREAAPTEGPARAPARASAVPLEAAATRSSTSHGGLLYFPEGTDPSTIAAIIAALEGR